MEDPAFAAIAERDVYLQCLRNLIEEIEMDDALPRLDLLDRGALNAVLQRFRFHQDQAQARIALSAKRVDELEEWRRVLQRYSGYIAHVEAWVRFGKDHMR